MKFISGSTLALMAAAVSWHVCAAVKPPVVQHEKPQKLQQSHKEHPKNMSLVSVHANSTRRANGTRQTPTVAPMPTKGHDKLPGGGYAPGSPLYAKQQARLEAGKGDSPKASSDTTTTQEGFIGWLIGELVYICLFLAAAYLYHTYKSQETMSKLPRRSGEGFNYGLFDFSDLGEDYKICCVACFCPGIRWAETVDMMKMKGEGLKFWLAIALLIVLHFLSVPTAGLAFIITVSVGVYYRRQLRTMANHPESKQSMCFDILAWCCCPVCAIAQEAREMEKFVL